MLTGLTAAFTCRRYWAKFSSVAGLATSINRSLSCDRSHATAVLGEVLSCSHLFASAHSHCSVVHSAIIHMERICVIHVNMSNIDHHEKNSPRLTSFLLCVPRQEIKYTKFLTIMAGFSAHSFLKCSIPNGRPRGTERVVHCGRKMYSKIVHGIAAFLVIAHWRHPSIFPNCYLAASQMNSRGIVSFSHRREERNVPNGRTAAFTCGFPCQQV